SIYTYHSLRRVPSRCADTRVPAQTYKLARAEKSRPTSRLCDRVGPRGAQEPKVPRRQSASRSRQAAPVRRHDRTHTRDPVRAPQVRRQRQLFRAALRTAPAARSVRGTQSPALRRGSADGSERIRLGGVMALFDITLPLTPGMPVWPGEPGPALTPRARIAAGDPANVTSLCLGSHTGTHIDAPRHFIEGGAGIESLSLDAL